MCKLWYLRRRMSVGAISEGDGKYEIDADACVDCGACEAACPTGAISEA